MKRSSLLFIPMMLLGSLELALANNPPDDPCPKKCKSCQTSCAPDANTGGSSNNRDTDPDNGNGDGKDDDDTDSCSAEEGNQNQPPSQQAGSFSHGIGTFNYERRNHFFIGVGGGYVKYETVGGVRVPRQMPTKHTTLDFTDTVDGYQKAEYLTSELGAPDANGIRSIPAGVEPVAVTLYRNPLGNRVTTDGRLDVVHKQRHPQSGAWVTMTIRFVSPKGNPTWSREFFDGDPAVVSGLQPYRSIAVTRTENLDGTQTVREVTRDRGSDNTLVTTHDETIKWGYYRAGEPVKLEQTLHSGNDQHLTQSWTYYTDFKDRSSFNKPATLRRSDGQWANYTYSGSPVTGVLVTKTVSGWLDNVAPAVGSPPNENANRVVVEIEAKHETGTFGREEKVQGTLISKTWGERYKANDGKVIEKSRVETGTATLLTTRTYAPKSNPKHLSPYGRLESVEFPDSTVELHRYAQAGDNLIETIDKGAGSLAGVTNGTRTVSTWSVQRELLKEVISDIASGVELSAREVIAFDARQKPTRWAYDHNPEDYSETLNGCCGVESTRTRDGVVTTYTWDKLKRPTQEVSLGVATTYTYGKKTIGGVDYPMVSLVKTAGSLTQDLGAVVHDHSGQVVEKISPDLNGDGQPEVAYFTRDITTRTITITNPDGGTEIDVTYKDSQPKSQSGTAVKATAWEYAPHTLQGGGLVTKAYAGNTTSTRWTKGYSNLAGNSLKETAPNDSGAEAATRANEYDAVGRMVFTQDGDNVTQLFAYNAEGERFRSAIDLNQNGSTDSGDRVSETLRDVVAESPVGAAIRVRNVIYDLSNNPKTLSVEYRAVNGLAIRQETLGIVNPSVSVKSSDIERANGAWTDTSFGANGTKVVVTYSNWRPVSQFRFDTENNPIEGISTSYDALGRVTASTRSRTAAAVVTRNAYDAAGQVVSVIEDLASGTDRVTSFGYDAMGRKVSTTLPDGSVSHRSYWPTSLEKAAWGSQTYPAVKLYNCQGQLTELHTFRSANLALAPDETTSGYDATCWSYDNRGLLIEKIYADGRGPKYTYTLGDRLHTRTWARSIVTTYGYNTAGEHSSTDYGDLTPDASISFDKLGRKILETNGVAQSEYAYDPTTLRLDYETVRYDVDGQPGFEFSRVLDRSNDVLGRDAGWQLKNNTTVENEVTYGYSNTAGRLETVTGLNSNIFTYNYIDGSSLIGGIAGPAHTVTNTWLSDRDVLWVKENKVGSATISRSEYVVGSLGQRTGVMQSGIAYATNRSTDWNYDSLGNVIKADSSEVGHDRVYLFDAIGNRKKSTDSLTLPNADNYDVNALNQYLSINAQPATVNPVYDNDGNATSYPLPSLPHVNSTINWDGENRMSETIVNGVATRYHYDVQFRRIAKIRNGVVELTVYDGWNPIAEYSATTLSNAYTWGCDVSGSKQGAGGVGGLLSVTLGGVAYSPLYDGNGNVNEYIAPTGAIIAHFEYDVFGRVVGMSGNIEDFRIRFSTKKEDSETGFYYYGYRYYDAVVGRWPSRDLLEELGGLNLFAFVDNKPISSWDYLGLDQVVASDPGHLGNNDASANRPPCDCVDPASQNSKWKLNNGTFKGGNIKIVETITFTIQKDDGTKVQVTCTTPAAMREKTKAHEEKHIENVKNKINSLNGQYVKEYPDKQACVDAQKKWIEEFVSWRQKEAAHANPESPAPTNTLDTAYNGCKAAGGCGGETPAK